VVAGILVALATATAARAATVTVGPGDTLSAIAARQGVSVAALARANGLRDPDRIVVGRVLRIPAQGGSAPLRSPAASPSRADMAALLDQHADLHGVQRALVRALAWQESGWWQGARSRVGAIGVMRLMPSTAAWVGPAFLGRRIDPTEARDNVAGGVAYLAWLLRRTGDTRAALASYYQGLRSVTRRGPLPETRRYVESVLSLVGRV
jgi:soluble lytic murein transglycosylase-like protein